MNTRNKLKPPTYPRLVISNGVKKFLLIAVFITTFAVVPHALAAASQTSFVPLAPIPGLTQGVTADTAGLANFFNNLYKYLVGLAAVLAVIMIIWGGLEYSTQDSVSKKSDGKERIYQAIFGLVLVLSPVLIFSIINPSILNLSINFQKLDTVTPPPGGGPPATTTPPGPTPPAGCTVTGTLLKTAVCQTQAQAQAFANNCTTGSGNVPFFTTQHKATCDTSDNEVAITGPYSFADISQSTGLTGWFNAIVGYSYYAPLRSVPENPNNGTDVLQFASACTNDGGTTCMSAIKTPCLATVVQLVTTGASVSCWRIRLFCTAGETGAGGCSSSPDFTIIDSR